MKMGGGKVVFGVWLMILGCSLFKLSDVLSMLSMVGLSTDKKFRFLNAIINSYVQWRG